VGENVLGFLTKNCFSSFSFVLLAYAEFSPRAVQGLCFLRRADGKSSFIQEKTKPSLGILGLTETCQSCLWRKKGFGESWQLFLAIHFPFQKAN